MVAKQLTSQQVDTYFRALLPEGDGKRTVKAADEMLGNLQLNFGNERNAMPGIRGTAWAAYNAVSEWADHQRDYRGSDEAARANNRLNSVWFGAANDVKQQAYASALALATAP